MKINSDINVLGSLPDWNLINVFLNGNMSSLRHSGGIHTYTAIKTDKSVKRFEKAISSTLIKFHNADVETLIRNILAAENISHDSLFLLFWNASFNNQLLHYLNNHIYFTSFYSGRVAIKQDEVVACIKDLKERESGLKKWSDSTLRINASKYLTLLKKFNLMEGTLNKTIVHPYLNDKMFIHFVYWITAIETKSNLLESEWLKYSFSEQPVFIERLLQKKFSKYYQLLYTGDRLKVETFI
ncbi:MAG: DUF1819 family protein, partial [Chitinophagaceae bacterium]|nr:DUF1819 family protein [Chitinophagaceae bacterium]